MKHKNRLILCKGAMLMGLSQFPRVLAQVESPASSAEEVTPEVPSKPDAQPAETAPVPPANTNEAEPPKDPAKEPTKDAIPEKTGATEPSEKDPKTSPPPPWALDRLKMQVGMGIGASGKSKQSNLQSDKLSFHLEIDYGLKNLKIKQNPLFIAFMYSGISGVKTDSNNGFAMQSFLFGPLIETELDTTKQVNLTGSCLLGPIKTSSQNLSSGVVQKDQYSFGVALSGKVHKQVLEKVDAYGGIHLSIGKVSRFDVLLGMRGSF
jgi:hypothetical protein